MREIGGYFGMDELIKNEYYPNLLALNSGRNALLYLIEAKQIKHITLPIFLCSSVSNAVLRSNCKISYYEIDEMFQPKLNVNLNNDQYIYIVNYFGQMTDRQIKFYKNKYKNIIVDNTQAFFQKPLDNIDTLYSCRKFFGVPDGSYLSTNSFLEFELEIDESKNRMTHILGRYETSATMYYEEFKSNDKKFTNLSLKKMSKLTKNLLGAVDYGFVKRNRNANFSVLSKNFSEINGLEISKPEAPFAYPLYVENGIKIKNELAKRKIFIPTLWPNVLISSETNSIEYKYASNILPLPCDQRYTTEDMEFIAKNLKGVM